MDKNVFQEVMEYITWLYDSSDNQEIKKRIADIALSLKKALTEQVPHAELGYTFSTIGLFFAELPIGSIETNQEMAIQCYHESLKVRTRDDAPMRWAIIKNNLGNAYCRRTKDDPSENIEMAIQCFHDVLEVQTRNSVPMEWAQTMNNLGSAYFRRINGIPSENREKGIQCYHEAVKVLTRDAASMKWKWPFKVITKLWKSETKTKRLLAMTKVNLGQAYQERINGDTSDNIEMAIQFFNEALELRSRNEDPMEWAAIINNLGMIYQKRIKGGLSNNIEIAIQYLYEALEVTSRDMNPKEWSSAKNHLGNAYKDRIKGDPSENLELAIQYYQEALEVLNCDVTPKSWAGTKNNLCNAYINRIQGDPSENKELAIKYLHEVLEECPRDTAPMEWAMTKNHLGNAYKDHIKGDPAKNLELAMQCYHEALEIRTRDDAPMEWAMTKINLGNTYQKLLTGDPAENIELAIKCINEALEECTRDIAPLDWATAKNNLGLAYERRIKGNHSENKELAIKCYHDALEETTREVAPKDWADTKHNLGSVYQDRVKGDPAENLKMAIQCSHEALEIINRDYAPIKWGWTKYNLGNAYRHSTYITKGDPSENQEMAIQCYHESLEECTYDAAPKDWAKHIHNLGCVYAERIKGSPTENQEMAIHCFHEALKIRTRDTDPMKWARTQNNLGSIYNERIEGDTSENQENAIQCFHEALKEYTRNTAPMDWASTKTKLGVAYANRINGDPSDNQEVSIQCYHNALEEYTRDADPKGWANTKTHLGIAYLKRIKGDSSDNQEMGIQCLREALEEYTRDTTPMDWASTKNSLGIAYHIRIKGDPSKNQNRAVEILESVIAFLEEVRSTIAEDKARKGFMDQNQKAYKALIDVNLSKKDYQKALYWLERTRSRVLLENIDLESLKPSDPAAQEKVQEYWELCKTIRSWRRNQHFIAKAVQIDTSPNQQRQHQINALAYATNEIEKEIKILMKERLECMKEIKAIDPQYGMQITGHPPKNGELAEFLTQQKAAALSFQTTSNTIHALVSLPEGDALNITLLKFPAIDILNELSNWVKVYEQEDQNQDLNRLMSILDKMLESTGQIMAPIKKMMDDKNIKNIFIAPHGYLNLIPFHAAILPNNSGYLLNTIQVSYTPSLTLAYMRHRFKDTLSATGSGYHLGMFCSPEGSRYLKFGKEEINYLENVYPKEKVFLRKNQDANIENLVALLDEKSGTPIEQLIFSCHGFNNIQQPELSGLLLSNGQPAPGPHLCQGNRVTKSEILSCLQGRKIGSVILSACETGQSISNFDDVDEYIGLDSIFMQMNVPAIISSLYRIYDASTTELMIKYHNYRKTGTDVGRALWQAQKDMIKDTNLSHSSVSRGLIKKTNDINQPASMRHPLHWAFMKYSGLFV